MRPMLLLFFLTGCLATIPDTRVETLDGRQVELAFVDRGTPATVVFEAGLGGGLEWWGKVFPAISKDTSAFASSRAGIGRSSRVEGPRDGATALEELRRVLAEKGVRPPYVLVGHSLGGLFMQLFARKYPAEVVALVLVDSTHPNQLEGDGAIERWPAAAKKALADAPPVTRAELDGLAQTGRDVLALPTYSGKVIVLSASQPLADDSTPTARDSNEKRRQLVTLYPNAEQRWVDSGHGIPLEKPEAVIEAVRAALEQR